MKTLAQFKKDVRNAKRVFAGTRVSFEDSNYIQVVKSDLLLQVANWSLDTPMNYTLDQFNDLYIN